jgi:hypothetical protein
MAVLSFSIVGAVLRRAEAPKVHPDARRISTLMPRRGELGVKRMTAGPVRAGHQASGSAIATDQQD